MCDDRSPLRVGLSFSYLPKTGFNDRISDPIAVRSERGKGSSQVGQEASLPGLKEHPTCAGT